MATLNGERLSKGEPRDDFFLFLPFYVGEDNKRSSGSTDFGFKCFCISFLLAASAAPIAVSNFFGIYQRRIQGRGPGGRAPPYFFGIAQFLIEVPELSSQNSTFIVKPLKASPPPPPFLAEGLDPPLYIYLCNLVKNKFSYFSTSSMKRAGRVVLVVSRKITQNARGSRANSKKFEKTRKWTPEGTLSGQTWRAARVTISLHWMPKQSTRVQWLS